MKKLYDIKRYYAVLGISNTASAQDIKRAFRQKAKELHPDHNSSLHAEAAFQEVYEAYQILSDPASRAQYDTEGVQNSTKVPLEPIEPIRCACCGKQTAQPRYVIYWQVISLIVVTFRMPIQGIFCRACADKKAFQASSITWLLGWWGFPWGLLYSAHAIFRNLTGGEKLADVNARLMAYQAAAFISLGNVKLGHSIIEEAVGLAKDQELLKQIQGFRLVIGADKEKHKLVNRWGATKSWSFYVQLLPMILMGLLTTSFLAYEVNSNQQNQPRGTVSLTSEQKDTQNSAELWYVNVDALNLRSGPGTQFKILDLLTKFSTVTIVDSNKENIWVRVRTQEGRLGFVSRDYLKLGSGKSAWLSWCQANAGVTPKSNKIIQQTLQGTHRLTIENGTENDAVFKLKDLSGSTIVTAFVKAQTNFSLSSIPDGKYKLMFATGDNYSTACRLFLNNMQVEAFPETKTFKISSDGLYNYSSQLAITLHPVVDGTVRTEPASVDEFLQD